MGVWRRMGQIQRCEDATLSVRKGTKAEEVYRHWGFEIYGELKGGIVEPWGDGKTYDELFMYKDL